MGRIRTRTWNKETELARAVDIVGGTKWAGAIMNVSEEYVVQRLQAGALRNPDKARLLMEAAAEHGHQANPAALMGIALLAVPPLPSGPRPGKSPNAKGGTPRRRSFTRLTTTHDRVSASAQAAA